MNMAESNHTPAVLGIPTWTQNPHQSSNNTLTGLAFKSRHVTSSSRVAMLIATCTAPSRPVIVPVAPAQTDPMPWAATSACRGPDTKHRLFL